MRLNRVLFCVLSSIMSYFAISGYADPDFLLLKKLLALRSLTNATTTTTTTTTTRESTTTSVPLEVLSTTVSGLISNGKVLSDAAVPLIMEFYKFIRKNKTMEANAKLLLKQFLGHDETLDNTIPVISDAKWIRKHVKPLLKSFLESDEDNAVEVSEATTVAPEVGTGLQNLNRTGRGWGGCGCCCGGGGGGGSDSGLLAAYLASQNKDSGLDTILPLLFGLIALLIMKLPT